MVFRADSLFSYFIYFYFYIIVKWISLIIGPRETVQFCNLTFFFYRPIDFWKRGNCSPLGYLLLSYPKPCCINIYGTFSWPIYHKTSWFSILHLCTLTVQPNAMNAFSTSVFLKMVLPSHLFDAQQTYSYCMNLIRSGIKYMQMKNGKYTCSCFNQQHLNFHTITLCPQYQVHMR